MTRICLLWLTIALALLPADRSCALPRATVKVATERVENTGSTSQKILLPYAFSTEGMGLTIGLGGILKGLYQDQLTLGATVFGGPENVGMVLGLWDLRLPQSRRLFVSGIGLVGYFPRQRAYAAPRNAFWPAGIPPPGSNDSSPDQVLVRSGADNSWEIKLEYALPIGATRDRGMVHYQLVQGILISEPSGGTQWNPLHSGASVVMLRHYNRMQNFELERETLSTNLHAFELGLLYNNTDFPPNPSRGSSQYIGVHHDPAWFSSRDTWWFWEVEGSKYFSLGASRHALQRIIALNAWTAYSPSWSLEFNDRGGSQVTGAPPISTGPTLGGFYRLRGYDQYRFQDKAAIYATAEYRYTLRWNPLRGVSWLSLLASDWFQLVPFVEGGRVAPSYTSQALFSDWKSNFGLGLRGMFGGAVLRLDFARSDEGGAIWAMFRHPF